MQASNTAHSVLFIGMNDRLCITGQFPMQVALLGPFGLWTSIERIGSSVFEKATAHAPNAGCSDAKGKLYLLVGPIGLI